MNAFNIGKQPPEVAQALGKVLAELVLLGKEDPLTIERVAELVDGGERDAWLMARALEILPAEIDARQWLDWIEGGRAPASADRLTDPERGQKKSARGAWQSAVDRRDLAAQQVTIAREKLAEAEANFEECELAVRHADAHLRAAVCYRLRIDEAKLLAGAFAMGPAFTLLRAISTYQRRDAAFEAALDEHGCAWIDEHIANRRDTARTIMELLDFLAGDAGVEIKLHHAIHKVLTEAYAAVEAERTEAKRDGTPLSLRAKRTMRNHDQRRTSVRREGLRNDYAAVLDGLEAGTSTDGDESPDDPAS